MESWPVNLARSVVFLVFICIITPPFSLVALLIWWLPARICYYTIGMWNRCLTWALVYICGIRYRVIGANNLPDPPYVICSKHQSVWETIAFHSIFPRQCFVSKRSLILIPFFGWGLIIGKRPILINRSAKTSALRAVLRIGAQRIKEGICVIIFPEGTRVPVGATRSFQPSAAALAHATQTSLVPVAHNSGTCWPSRLLGFAKRPGLITVSIGECIATNSRRARDINEQAANWITAETKRLGG